MNEMIQESILERIDNIDSVVLESEAEVLLAMSNAYLRSVMIQETVSPDAVEMIQEASIGEKIKNSKPIQLLKQIWDAIVKFFKMIGNKIKEFFRKLNKDRIKSLVRMNKSEVVDACKKAGFKIKTEDDGSWTCMVPSFDLNALIEAEKAYGQYLEDMDSALQMAGGDRGGVQNLLKQMRSLENNFGKAGKAMEKALKANAYVAVDEFESQGRQAAFLMDNLVKYADKVKNAIQNITDARDSGGEENADLNQSGTSAEINSLVQLSKLILDDVTKANSAQVERLTEIEKTIEEMWKKVNDTLHTGEEKFYAKTANDKNKADKRAEYHARVDADAKKLRIDNNA